MISFISIIVITVGIISVLKFNEYYASLPDEYYYKYSQAIDNGDYEEAKELHKKYLKYYWTDQKVKEQIDYIEEYNYKNLLPYKNKKELVNYEISKFEDLCESMKFAESALECIANGYFEEGNKLFTQENGADMGRIPYERAKELFIKILENINPVQLASGYNSLYWLNQNGTVGTIGGNSLVNDWKDIVEINTGNSFSIIAGLKNDGTLFYKDKYDEQKIINNVINYDVNGNVLAAVKTDGTVECSGLHVQGGRDIIEYLENIESVRIVKGNLYRQSLYWGPNSEYQEPQIKTDTDYDAYYLIAQTKDGEEIVSGYNIEIIKPKQATAEEIIDSIAEGWGGFFQKRDDLMSGRSLGKGYTEVKTPVTVKNNYSTDDSDRVSISIYGRYLYFVQDNNGKWIVS